MYFLLCYPYRHVVEAVAFPTRATPSVVLSAILVGCVFGVGTMAFIEDVAAVVFVAMFLALTCAVMFSGITPRDRLLVVGLASVGFAFGAWRLQSVGPSANSIARYVGATYEVTGTVRSRDVAETSQQLTLDRLVLDTLAVDDRLRVSMPLYPRAFPGDLVTFICTIEAPQPFDGFAYDRYLAARDVYAICRSFADPIVVRTVDITLRDRLGRSREWAIDVIERTFGEPHAALLSGLLFGTSRFPDAWSDRFALTGTSHIVAASGYNVAIVAKLLMAALIAAGLWRRQAFGLVLLGLIGYVMLAGGEAPVVRAAIMGALVLVAERIGRRSGVRNLVLVAVVGMLIVEPRLLRDDVGFQLSVLSTVGLITIAPLVSRRLLFVPETAGLREALASTLAATLTTLPIIVGGFGLVSLVAPIANVLILPFVPYVMALGAAALVVGIWSTTIAAIVAFPAWLGLSTIVSVVYVLADVPFTSFATDGYPVVAVLIAVALVVGVSLTLRRMTTPTIESVMPAWATLSGLVVLMLFLFMSRQTNASSSALTVWVFDVGQGDGIFIDGPERDVLIDGGSSRVIVEKISDVFPSWDRSIDRVVMTHAHSDHMTGLAEVMRRYRVGEFISGGGASGVLASSSFPLVQFTSAGDVYELGDGATLTTLWPTRVSVSETDDLNEDSVVLFLRYGETTMLLTGDALADAESQWPVGAIDVLKVGHHGSDTSTSWNLLRQTTPSTAIISVGSENDYGHPSPFVLDRLVRNGANVFRTDRDGDVVVESDGGEPTIRALKLW